MASVQQSRGSQNAQARLQPLDNAEQDQILRLRLSRTLAYRPISTVRHKLASLASVPAATDESSVNSSEQVALLSNSLASELQNYLLSITRTSLISSDTCQAQIAEYDRQYAQIKQEEQESIERIAELKKQLEDVRRRRREKIEYGRVAESIERWFKTGGGSAGGSLEIEESLSTLLSHLTSSFLYQPAIQSSSATTSTHSQTLSTLHSKLDEMLNLSRQIREVVGWKPGTGPPGGVSTAPSTAGQEAGLASTSTDSAASKPRMNPNAKSFEPSALPPRPARRHQLSRGSSSRASPSLELEEGEEPSDIPGAAPATAAGRKRKKGDAGIVENGEDDDEEGSIPTAAGATAASGGQTAGTGGNGNGNANGNANAGSGGSRSKAARGPSTTTSSGGGGVGAGGARTSAANQNRGPRASMRGGGGGGGGGRR